MVLSENMQKLVAGNSAIRKMFELGQELAAKVGKDNVYDFSLGNPASPVPEEVKEKAIAILNEKNPNYVHGYMANAGFQRCVKRSRRILIKSMACPMIKMTSL